MNYPRSKLSIHPNSKAFFLLPKGDPPFPDLLYQPFVVGHEYPKLDHFIEREGGTVYMINYVIAGKGRFIYDGTTYDLTPGTLTLADLGKHNIFYPITEDFEIYYTHFKGGQILQVFNTLIERNGIIFRDFPRKDADSLWTELTKIIEEDDRHYHFAMHSAFDRFLTGLLARSVTSKNTPSLSPLARRARNLMLGGTFSANELAQAVNVSTTYLNRIYKQFFGKNLRESITLEKLRRAENFLLTTDLSVYEIATLLGYADSNGLIALFKKFHNCTPLDFRKRRGNV